MNELKEQLKPLINQRFTDVLGCWEIPPQGVLDGPRAQAIMDRLLDEILNGGPLEETSEGAVPTYDIAQDIIVEEPQSKGFFGKTLDKLKNLI